MSSTPVSQNERQPLDFLLDMLQDKFGKSLAEMVAEKREAVEQRVNMFQDLPDQHAQTRNLELRLNTMFADYWNSSGMAAMKSQMVEAEDMKKPSTSEPKLREVRRISARRDLRRNRIQTPADMVEGLQSKPVIGPSNSPTVGIRGRPVFTEQQADMLQKKKVVRFDEIKLRIQQKRKKLEKEEFAVLAEQFRQVDLDEGKKDGQGSSMD